MHIAGLRMTDPWADRVLRERGIETVHLHDEACELGVLIDHAHLDHHGPDQSYRPRVRLSGELRSVRPTGVPWPYGIDEVTFAPGTGEMVDAVYEFDDPQLTALVAKGYFRPGFEVPSEITGFVWELPAQADALVLAPAGGEVPAVFVRIHDIAQLQTDLATSGYDLVEYFPDRSAQPVAPTSATTGPEDLHADQFETLFSDDGFLDVFDSAEATDVMEHPTGEAGPQSEGSELTRQINEVEAQLAAEREQARREREALAGTPENLYRQRVSTVLADADAATLARRAQLDETSYEAATRRTRDRQAGERRALLDHMARDISEENNVEFEPRPGGLYDFDEIEESGESDDLDF